ncbi:Na/Pi cotransporter family protein [Virgibacillus sp. YIM 98842]|jgi:phosphate:Na+ symporter|uniref:Na/Pi cotransporter family protein n=1 Tax=Virgibacillus sp. YIM 98842 TaxID=2663533 RepID=UPI0013DC617E|nr:Na/Pi cotransporter family protein [Virgibacillus sp. YIM 98842]
MEFLTIILGFFGGLGIFLYGTHLLSNSLQRIAASKIRAYLIKITDKRWKGIFSGIAATFFLQSSTVTSILVVGLVSSAVLSLSQAFGIIIGSAIGTTLTVQVLTFNISEYSTLFIFFGAVITVFIKHSKWKNSGLILLSIGFIFYGISLISSSVSPVSSYEPVIDALLYVSGQPVLFAFLAMLLAALFHSSAAVILIGIAFIDNGIMTAEVLIPLILGANAGSAIPVIVSSLSMSSEGKKLAFFSFLFNFSGAVLFLIFLPIMMQIIGYLPGDPGRQVAHFHTLFNVVNTLIFLPLLPMVAKGFKHFFPEKEEEPVFRVKLNDKILDVPEEALIHSKREIVKLATLVQTDMIKQLVNFMDGKHEAKELVKTESIIDTSYITIQKYLLKLGQNDLTNSQSNEEVKLLHILNDIEHIGDSVLRFVGAAEKVSKKNIELGKKDLSQIKELLFYIERANSNSLSAFRDNDTLIARENIQSQSFVNQFENDIKFEHFNSLINKQEYNPDISAVYLDITNQLLQIYKHSMNISRTVLGLI